MVEQRPLVDAATIVRTAVEAAGFDGLASIVIETKSVTVWWKGGEIALPGPLAAVVDRASKVAPVRVANARYSMSELLAASTLLEGRLRADARFHGIKAKPDGSGLIVKVDAAGPQLSNLVVPDVGVPAIVSVEARMQPVSRGNDSSPWSGGAEIINTSIGAGCTSGFGVNTPGGGRAILTAGHCGNPNNRITDGAGEFIGNVGADDNNFDVLIVPTNAVTNRIYIGGGNSNQQLTVTSGGAPFIGELLCQSGNTSANAVGGPVCNMQVQFEGTDSQRLWEARQLDGQIAARPGDSGGPVYDDRGNGTVIARGTSTRVAGSGFGFAGFEKAQQNFGVSIPGGGGDPGPGAGVVFFQHVNFGGAATQSLSPGRYTLSALEARGFVNDWASSVRIPSGRSITMFEHDNFQGIQWTLSADRASFRTLQPGANDVVSSVIVR
ncbi:MAG TPA: hypothetical protein VFR67_12080 [Pilimelia sp.]|nr:hypothetical protein [Pilimelia sp.]